MSHRLSVTLSGLILLGAMAPVLGGGTTVLSSFPGTSRSGTAYKLVPDCAGAVGPNHVVDFNGYLVVVRDKATGAALQSTPQRQWWLNAGIDLDLGGASLGANDPRMLYDPNSQRWFAVCNQWGSVGYGFLAVSSSSDPTQPFSGVLLPVTPYDLGSKIGVDKNGFYLTVSSPSGMDAWAIPIADAIAPGGPDLSHIAQFTGLQVELYPATDLNPSKAPNAPEVLLCHEEIGDYVNGAYGTYSNFFMYQITWSGTTASISPVQTIPLANTYYTGCWFTPSAPQPGPGSPIRLSDPRRTQSVWAYGTSVFTCNIAMRSPTSNGGIFWAEFDVNSGQVLQESVVDDTTNGYIACDIAVDANGNVGIGCARTSPSEFASVYVMTRGAGDPPNTMGAPVLAVAGTTSWIESFSGASGRPAPWGNYTTTCIDPSNQLVFWTYQQYANDSTLNQWDTAWASFSYSGSTPGAPVITSPLTATGTVGTPFSYSIAATNSPTSFGATGLPGWASLDPVSGIISGTPTAAGTSSVTISATNSAGTGSATLTLASSSGGGGGGGASGGGSGGGGGGRCGSVGLDLLWPLALLWWARRARRPRIL